MNWYCFYFLSLSVFILSLILFIAGKKTKAARYFGTRGVLLAGVVLSAIFLLYPIYMQIYTEDDLGFLESLFASMHTTIRMFVVDGELQFVSDNLSSIPGWLYYPYFVHASILFLVAPMLTIGFVLSFFEKLRIHRTMVRKRKLPMFVLSDLNEKSLLLADSIEKECPKSLIVFMGVKENSRNRVEWLKGKASESGYLCCKEGITSMDFSMHSSESRVCFFAISPDENVNIEDGLALIAKYKQRSCTELYIFSKGKEAEMLFSSVESANMTVRRVNEARCFIYHRLYNNGYKDIFQSALPCDGGKKISAIVVGLDEIGTEYAKTLAWFGQMDGYKLEINAYAAEKNGIDRFMLKCPELLSFEYNNNFTDDGDAQYSLNVHEGIDFESDSFYNSAVAISDASYVIVTCGNDEMNIKVATELRARFERAHLHPIIQAITTDNAKKTALKDVTDYAGRPYDIELIGDAKSLYSVDVILNSELDRIALERHKKWGDEKAFWLYEYNYKSSLASTLHRKMKKLCGIPGIELPPEERNEDDRIKLRKLEHRRWNAYMRSEGFVYSGSCEKSSRNTLAKTHNCLVTFDKLTLAEQEKDDD